MSTDTHSTESDSLSTQDDEISWILWQSAWNILDNDEERVGEWEEDYHDGFDLLIDHMLPDRTLHAAEKEVNDVYTGPVIEYGGMDEHILQHLLRHFNEGYILPYLYAENLVKMFLRMMMDPVLAMNEICTIPGGRLVVVGDLHGQYPDLMTVLDLIGGAPSSENIIVFNGDIVDRGPHGAEVLFVIMALKVQYPDFVYVNRGNHELRRMNEKYNFKDQILDAYDYSLFNLIIRVFDHLPMCTLVNDKIFIVHGGLFQFEGVTLDEIRKLKDSQIGKDCIRRTKMKTREQLLCDNMLWSDPSPNVEYWEESERNAGIVFGRKMVQNFVELNNIDIVVRSHQLVDEGFQFLFDNTILTVFSASEYTGVYDNYGSIAFFKHDGDNNKPEIITYKAYIVSFEEQVEKCLRETLGQIYDRIYSKRAMLALEFSKVEQDGTVEIEELMNILELQISSSLPWEVILPYLTVDCTDNRGDIIYMDFLSGYVVEGEEFFDSLVQKIVLKLFEAQQNIEQFFDILDTNGDGVITFDEFSRGISSVELGISNDTLFDFMKSFDQNNDGEISLNEFKSRFEVAAVHEKFSHDVVTQLSITELGTALLGSGTLETNFKNFDKNGDNYLNKEEFVEMVNQVSNLHSTDDELDRLFEYIDVDTSGTISYHEFTSAFKIIDTMNENWKELYIGKLSDTIRLSKRKLRNLFRELDEDDSKTIDRNEFTKGLTSLGIITKNEISDIQAGEVFDCIDTNHNGKIEYQEFCNAFSVKRKKSEKLEIMINEFTGSLKQSSPRISTRKRLTLSTKY